MVDTSYTIPGVYLETPRSKDTRVRGVPLGVAGFIGYASVRKGSDAESPSGGSPWPVLIQSIEDLEARIETPPWGNLQAAIRGFFENGGSRCFVSGLPWDVPHNPTTVLGGGGPGERHGLTAIDVVDEAELIAAPDLFVFPPSSGAPDLGEIIATTHTILDFCSGGPQGSLSGGKYFAILDSPPAFPKNDLIDYARYLSKHPAAAFGALFYPWIDVPRQDGTLKRLPPSGQIAGILAGLTRPPAGMPPGTVTADSGPHLSAGNHVLADAIGAEEELRRVECRELLEANINSIIPWSGRGMVVWGTRTLSKNEEINQIATRRVLSFIERSVYFGTQWAVFEPNDPALWKQLTARTEVFLEEIWKAGLLAGETQSEAFYVKCDEETNPPGELEEGRINIVLMVRPVRSVEFIVLKITHQGGQTTEE